MKSLDHLREFKISRYFIKYERVEVLNQINVLGISINDLYDSEDIKEIYPIAMDVFEDFNCPLSEKKSVNFQS